MAQIRIRVRNDEGPSEERIIDDSQLPIFGATAEVIGPVAAAQPKVPITQTTDYKSNLAAAAAQRKAGMDEGRKMGEEFFAKGSLGRVDEKRAQEIKDLIAARGSQAKVAGQRSTGMQDIVARRQQALQGFSPAELQAMKEQQQGALNAQNQLAQRQMRAQQASSGIRGGAAMAAQSALQQNAQREMARGARELALQNIGQKEKALGSYESTLGGQEQSEFQRQQMAQKALEDITGGARADELKRQTFNIGQGTQEKMGKLASILGMAGLSSQEAAAAAQQALGSQQLDIAQQQAAKPSGKK